MGVEYGLMNKFGMCMHACVCTCVCEYACMVWMLHSSHGLAVLAGCPPPLISTVC